MEQRTAEWFAARAGRVTASRVADVIARTKSGYSSSRANYRAELIVERLTGKPAETYQNAAMVWGIEQEPFARARYEDETGLIVEEVGFVQHPKIAMSGASPDGRLGVEGLIEIKCPNTATHIETLSTRKIPAKYVTQMQWQMACTTASWCDFVSFDPRMPKHLQYFCDRLARDDKIIAELEKEVGAFLKEIDLEITQLNNLYKENNDGI
jgi:putative phage-type endonuclease